MFGPKGYNSFLVVLVRNRILILAILVSNRVWFLHSSLELDMFLNLSYLKKEQIIIAFTLVWIRELINHFQCVKIQLGGEA